MAATPWDEGQIFHSDPLERQPDTTPDLAVKVIADFLKNYQRDNVHIYREQLRRHYNDQKYTIELDLSDLMAFNAEVASAFEKNPAEYLPLFERQAAQTAHAITHTPEDAPVRDIQLTFTSRARPSKMRDLGSAHVGRLVKVPGIIISAGAVRAKATELKIQCRGCQDVRVWPVNPGFGGAQLPRTCPTGGADGGNKCPVDPYAILADKSVVVDQQILKLQEKPEDVPTGEIPRHMALSTDRYLVDRVAPGSRCTITGIYSIFASKASRGSSAGTRTPYIQAIGIETEVDGAGRTSSSYSAEEVEEFKRMSKEDDIHTQIWESIAPSIYGCQDIKKAVASLLFGGSTKLLPDGMRLRGDINVLLLGDPGTAKSQILKFAERVAPIGVYTSGKGSSAAGLTASVVRDASSRDFYLEGGAMVLADGGIVCIDEFDKMRESDRVAIHEAMEQQTISVAKAGITTTLNSRTSVLAAANSVFGRWDDTKTTDENIEFQSTILSRFDLIFIVKDEHNAARDKMLAKHVMNTHIRASNNQEEEEEEVEGRIESGKLKRFISYARMHCGPRMSDEARDKLLDHFVKLRSERRKAQEASGKRNTIPITVRQLEALVRLTESLAKMELKPFATAEHVDEAIRLFKVSTVEAALTGQEYGLENLDDPRAAEELLKAEKHLKKRLPVGSRAAEHRIILDLTKQHYAEATVRKVLGLMLRRGELEHTMQGKVVYRVR